MTWHLTLLLPAALCGLGEGDALADRCVARNELAFLRQRGVSDEDIAAALPEAGDEAERCRAIWVKKFGTPPVSAEERAKQMRFLQYRGFSGEAIRRVMRGANE